MLELSHCQVCFDRKEILTRVITVPEIAKDADGQRASQQKGIERIMQEKRIQLVEDHDGGVQANDFSVEFFNLQ